MQKRWLSTLDKNFNPRTRVECDILTIMAVYDSNDFNPRTRVECDSSPRMMAVKYCNFNPRTRVECDTMQDAPEYIYILFQSTHSCRVRLQWALRKFHMLDISIHALV